MKPMKPEKLKLTLDPTQAPTFLEGTTTLVKDAVDAVAEIKGESSIDPLLHTERRVVKIISTYARELLRRHLWGSALQGKLGWWLGGDATTKHLKESLKIAFARSDWLGVMSYATMLLLRGD